MVALHMVSSSRVKFRVRTLCTQAIITKHHCVRDFLLEQASCKPLTGQVTSLASTEISQFSDHRFHYGSDTSHGQIPSIKKGAP